MKQSIAAISLALVLHLPATGAAAQAATGTVPDPIRAAADSTLVMIVPAKGVQVYECRATTQSAGTFEWAFVAPEADLFDTQSRTIGKHFAGPHWEANDGSRIAGSVRARADATAADAIPWLLLAAQSVGGAGAFGSVTQILRINTQGGVAPAQPCHADNLGTISRVPYTADYHFYRQN